MDFTKYRVEFVIEFTIYHTFRLAKQKHSSSDTLHSLHINLPAHIRTDDLKGYMKIVDAYDQLEALMQKYHVEE